MKKDYLQLKNPIVLSFKEQMMEELFIFYYDQCPKAKIKYAIYDSTKTQGHIVLEEQIEIIHFTNYQGGFAIKFAISRNDDEFFFNNYRDAVKYSRMAKDKFDNYCMHQ